MLLSGKANAGLNLTLSDGGDNFNVAGDTIMGYVIVVGQSIQCWARTSLVALLWWPEGMVAFDVDGIEGVDEEAIVAAQLLHGVKHCFQLLRAEVCQTADSASWKSINKAGR